MATIKQQGNGYKITVSLGYGPDGRQVRRHTTWIPSPGMTERQIEKEVQRQAVLFEEQIRGGAPDKKVRFSDFSAQYMRDYGAHHLKPKTFATYTENLVKINAALGHIRLNELRTTHINAFYSNLQEEGIRRRQTAILKFDLSGWLSANHVSLASLERLSGVSRSTIKSAIDGHPIAGKSAKKIAAALKRSLKTTFDLQADTRPLAPASVLSYHRTLSAILCKAVQWGYLQYNPAAAAEKPSLGDHEAPYLDDAGARQLLELLQNEPIKWRTLCTFDLLSGLRRGELLGLRWQDVDFDACTITVCQTLNYLPGRGLYIGTPKTARSRRPVHLSSSAMLMLSGYRRWQDAQREKLGDAWEDQYNLVFTSDIGAPIFPDAVSQWFSGFIRRSGLPKITIHSLRHTFATLMIADGVPLLSVSKQLGHVQVSTTGNIYAHAIASAQALAAQTFNRFDDLVIPEAEQIPTIKKAQ